MESGLDTIIINLDFNHKSMHVQIQSKPVRNYDGLAIYHDFGGDWAFVQSRLHGGAAGQNAAAQICVKLGHLPMAKDPVVKPNH